MALALQILASGFAAGAVYGLVGVGHSIVFRLTGVVHFAFGELIALGVFVTLYVAARSGAVSRTSIGGGRGRPRRRRRGLG
jgi:branched-chain amino acid transport system permease protein